MPVIVSVAVLDSHSDAEHGKALRKWSGDDGLFNLSEEDEARYHVYHHSFFLLPQVERHFRVLRGNKLYTHFNMTTKEREQSVLWRRHALELKGSYRDRSASICQQDACLAFNQLSTTSY